MHSHCRDLLMWAPIAAILVVFNEISSDKLPEISTSFQLSIEASHFWRACQRGQCDKSIHESLQWIDDVYCLVLPDMIVQLISEALFPPITHTEFLQSTRRLNGWHRLDWWLSSLSWSILSHQPDYSSSSAKGGKQIHTWVLWSSDDLFSSHGWLTSVCSM